MNTGQSSLAYTCDATPLNWCLYGDPNVACGKIEKAVYEKQPYTNIVTQDILGIKMNRSQFTEVMERALRMGFDSVSENHPESDIRRIFADVFAEIAGPLRYDTLPTPPCRITQLPDSLFELAISYQSPRDLRALRGVSHQFNQVSMGFEQASLLFYCKGRLAWFADNGEWVLGIVICYVDIVNPVTYVASKGIHVYTENGNTTYFANSELAKYSHFRPRYEAPVCPAHITRTNNECPDGNDPHNICPCGYYLTDCGLANGTTAPSSCDVFITDVNMKPQFVGCVIYMGGLTLHNHHQRISLEREEIHGIAYKPTGTGVIRQVSECRLYIDSLMMLMANHNHNYDDMPELQDADFNYDDMPALQDADFNYDDMPAIQDADFNYDDMPAIQDADFNYDDNYDDMTALQDDNVNYDDIQALEGDYGYMTELEGDCDDMQELEGADVNYNGEN
jgi:hypothetical protein